MTTMSVRARCLARLALSLVPLLGSAPVARAQTSAGRLIAAARAQLDSLNADSASVLLQRALAPGTDATPPDKVRGYVLLGVTELIGDREFSARLAFREALRYYPDLRIDSLAQLHSNLLAVFSAERAALPPGTRPAVPSYLEFSGLPHGARVTVDGVQWSAARQEVAPGMHRFTVRASGYLDLLDSLVVDVGMTAIRDVQLARAPPGPRRFEVGLAALVLTVPQAIWDSTPGSAGAGSPPLLIGAAVRLAFHFSKSVAIAGTLGASGDQGPLTADGGYQALELVLGDRQARTSAYALVGVSHIYYNIGEPGVSRNSYNGQSAHAGIGLHHTLWNRLALAVEARAFVWQQSFQSGSVSCRAFSVGLGLSYGL